MSRPIRICIITTNKGAYSETFIRNHIRELPFEKSVLYGGQSAITNWDTDRPLVPSLVTKLLNKTAPRQAVWLSTYRLARFLKRKKIRLVLAEFGPVGEHVLDACRQAKVPLVVHFHGDDAHAEAFLTRYGRYQRLLTYAAAVVAVSQPMAAQLVSLGFPTAKVHRIPYGIDTAFFTPGNPETTKPHFVAVGRFVDKKAPHLTILAFSRALAQVPNATLTLIGTGPLLLSCKTLAKALQITEQVRFRGVCPPEEVRQTLHHARAFVMHSLTPETGNQEGTPLSILEASAMGLPVVSTRHAGIPEAVVDGKTGFLVDECDINGMADRMVALAQRPELAQQLGQAGRQHIQESYNLATQINKLADLIRRTVIS